MSIEFDISLNSGGKNVLKTLQQLHKALQFHALYGFETLHEERLRNFNKTSKENISKTIQQLQKPYKFKI